ncbi:MAG: hypothetical protein ABWY39_06750 [Mycobacterium sp.]
MDAPGDPGVVSLPGVVIVVVIDTVIGVFIDLVIDPADGRVGTPLDVLIHAKPLRSMSSRWKYLLVVRNLGGRSRCVKRHLETRTWQFSHYPPVDFFYAEDATGERYRPGISDRLGEQRAPVAAAVP